MIARSGRSVLAAGLGAAMGLVLSLSLVAGAAQADETAARGAELFQLCTQCHGANGGGNQEALAPAIAGMPVWYLESQLKKFKSGVRGLHADDTAGLRMYPMSLWLRSEADQKAVAAYVASLPATNPPAVMTEPGNAAAGAGYYAVCSACHGPAAGGNQGMGAPPLKGQSDWYLFESISKYKSGVRGSGPGDALGSAMVGMAGTLPDEQAIRDVIAHIQSLQ